MDGQPLILKGVNWYGFETGQGVVHGLYAQPVSAFMDLLKSNGFNAVRLPLDLDLILHDRKHGYIKPEPDELAAGDEACFDDFLSQEPDTPTRAHDAALRASVCAGPSPLMKNTSLEVLDIMIDKFAESGILVLLDLHCLSTQGTNASPLFYDKSHPIEQTVSGWGTLAKRLGRKWNVIGADVFNEPFGATWATGKASDMDAFALKSAAAIAEHAPDWLVFVEGSAKSPKCDAVIDGDEVQCGFGDNLMGAMTAPICLPTDRLVYSMHTYGPSQHDRPEFTNAKFPANMPDVWDAHWGALVSNRTARTPALVLGEWGGPTDGENGQWADALVSYLVARDLTSNFFWALNQDGAPEGIITNWKVAPMKTDAGKLALLSRLNPKPTPIKPPARKRST